MGVTARVSPAVFLVVSLEATPACAMRAGAPEAGCLGGTTFAHAAR